MPSSRRDELGQRCAALSCSRSIIVFSLPDEGGAESNGWVAFQWRAMSIRAATQTRSCASTWSRKRCKARIAAGAAEQAAVHADAHHLRRRLGRLRRTARRSVAQVDEEVARPARSPAATRSACRWRRACRARRVRRERAVAPSRPAARTAGRRRSSRCRTRSRRARRRGGACSGCRGRCTSRSGRSPVSALEDVRCRRSQVCALGRLVEAAGSGSSASRGRRSRGRARRKAAATSGARSSAMRDPEDGERQAAPLELAQQPPDPGARAVFVEAFHAEVARRERRAGSPSRRGTARSRRRHAGPSSRRLPRS